MRLVLCIVLLAAAASVVFAGAPAPFASPPPPAFAPPPAFCDCGPDCECGSGCQCGAATSTAAMLVAGLLVPPDPLAEDQAAQIAALRKEVAELRAMLTGSKSAPRVMRMELRQVCGANGVCRTVQVPVYGDAPVDPFDPGPSPTPGPSPGPDVDPFEPGGGGGRQPILRIFGGPGVLKSIAARRGVRGGGCCGR